MVSYLRLAVFALILHIIITLVENRTRSLTLPQQFINFGTVAFSTFLSVSSILSFYLSGFVLSAVNYG